MNYNLTGIAPRFMPRAVGLDGTRREVAGADPAGNGAAGTLGPASVLAYAAILAVLAFAFSPARYLLTRQLPAGTEVAGLALLAATALCYLKVMFGALTGAPPRAAAVNLIALAACTFVAPIPVHQSWLALGFLLPAAAASGFRWPIGLWLGLGALPAAFATALALGETVAAAGRATAQDALVASALTGVVMLAARAEEFGQLRATVVTMTNIRAGTEERLHQANVLLDILGWRLSIIGRMSDLASRMSAERPVVTGHVLDEIHRLAVEWPRETVSGPVAGSARELSAEIEAVRVVLAAAGIRGEAGAVPADVPEGQGDLLALAVRHAALAMLRRRNATSWQIAALDDDSLVGLMVTCDGSPQGKADPAARSDLAGLARRVAAASGQCDYTEEDGGFRLRVQLPRGEPAVK